MDTLSILLQILGIIVNCAKLVAVIVLFIVVLAMFKYVFLRFRGLLPTVAMTAFVFSILSADVAQLRDFIALMWGRLANIIFAFSGGVTLAILLFAILLCFAIATELEVLARSRFEIVKFKFNEKNSSVDACNMSNSYLATTPVLLS